MTICPKCGVEAVNDDGTCEYCGGRGLDTSAGTDEADAAEVAKAKKGGKAKKGASAQD